MEFELVKLNRVNIDTEFDSITVIAMLELQTNFLLYYSSLKALVIYYYIFLCRKFCPFTNFFLFLK